MAAPLTAFVATILLFLSTSSAVHVGVLLTPSTDYFDSVLAIMDELVAKGDTVTVFSFKDLTRDATGLKEWKAQVRGDIRWEVLTSSSESKRNPEAEEHTAPAGSEGGAAAQAGTTSTCADALNAALGRWRQDHQGEWPDVFVVDTAVGACPAVERLLLAPQVVLWPWSALFPGDMHFAVPHLFSGFSVQMTYRQRLLNIAMKVVGLLSSRWTADASYLPEGILSRHTIDMLHRSLVLVQGVHGFDISEPRCPNIVAVGLLPSPLWGALTKEWHEWLDACTQGFVYVDVGHLLTLEASGRWEEEMDVFVQAMGDQGVCVVRQSHKRAMQETRRTKVVHKLPFSRRVLLSHDKARAVVMHCAATLVYEAIAVHVPVVGVPLLADEHDVCSRVVDARIGLVVDPDAFTGAVLAAKTTVVLDHEVAIRQRLVRIAGLSEGQGQTVRAAQVIHAAAALGSGGQQELYCDGVDEPWFQQHDEDIYLLLGLAVFGLLHITAGVRAVLRGVWGVCRWCTGCTPTLH